MVEATDDDTTETLAVGEVQNLADRLFGAAITSRRLADTKRFRGNLKLASRTIRGLLTAYERDAGRTLATLTIIGG